MYYRNHPFLRKDQCIISLYRKIKKIVNKTSDLTLLEFIVDADADADALW